MSRTTIFIPKLVTSELILRYVASDNPNTLIIGQELGLPEFGVSHAGRELAVYHQSLPDNGCIHLEVVYHAGKRVVWGECHVSPHCGPQKRFERSIGSCGEELVSQCERLLSDALTYYHNTRTTVSIACVPQILSPFDYHIQWDSPSESVEFADPNQLDEFTRAYIEAALWTTYDDEVGKPLSLTCGFSRLAPSTLSRIVADCHDFQRENAAYLACGHGDKQAGYDFWTTRNRIFSGFPYSDWFNAGPQLVVEALAFGEVKLERGEGGQLYFSR